MDSELGKELKECELCGSEEIVEIPYIRQYTGNIPFHICKGCGLVHYKYRRTPQKLAEYWENEMYKKGNYVARNPYFKARHTYAAEFLDVHLNLNGKKLIDIGAGDGQFLEILKTYGTLVEGIDSSETNHELILNNGMKNYLGTIEDYYEKEIILKNKKPNADIVSILWTLQNSQSVTDMLKAARSCLKDDGYLFVQLGLRILTPFHKPIDTYFTNIPGDLEPYRFSINTLNGFLAKVGFEIIHTNNYWDQDVLNIIAQKKSENEDITWKKDNYEDVLNYLIRWKNESDLMVEYLDILDLDYKFYEKQLFWKRKGLL